MAEAHWTRGAKLLQVDLDAAGGRHAEFITGLAAMAHRGGVTEGVGSGQQARLEVTGAMTVKVGEVSTRFPTEVPVSLVLNAPGVSPHMALLGKTRSGKTRTGIVMAEQIASRGSLPMLLIDPKGEFVNEGGFAAKPEWGGQTLADRFPELQALDVPRQTVPLDFLYRAERPPDVDAARLAIAFKD